MDKYNFKEASTFLDPEPALAGVGGSNCLQRRKQSQKLKFMKSRTLPTTNYQQDILKIKIYRGKQ